MKKLNGYVVFLILIIVALSIFYYDSLLDHPPMGIHQWRQTDCLVLTRNYMKGASFFEPELDILLADNYTTGKSAGEFPLLYYVVGKIWTLTGENLMLYRLLYLTILLACLYTLFKSAKYVLNNDFYAATITLLLYTSPLFVFYGVSFLTDVPAFCFSVIAVWFLIRYYQKAVPHAFSMAMLFFALAGLIKVSSLIPFLFFGFILLIESVFKVKTLKNQTVFKNKWYEWAGFSVVLLVIVAWYWYAHWYNLQHQFKYTFNAPYPVWKISGEKEWMQIIEGIRYHISPIFHNQVVWAVLLPVFIINLFLKNKIPPMAYWANILLPLGGLIYFMLWLPLFGIHDYYYTPFLSVMLGIFIPFIYFLSIRFKNNKYLKTITGIFLIYSMWYAVEVVNLRKISQSGNDMIVNNEKFVSLMHWSNWNKSVTWDRFQNIEKYFIEIGVNPEDKIIALPDPSFSISLFYTNRKGWTNYMNYHKKEDIKYLIDKGAKFLFILDEKVLEENFIQPFITNPVGNYNGILIYRLSK